LFGRKAEQFKDAKEEEQTRAEAKASARISIFEFEPASSNSAVS
jgi:hypothetical protein